MIVSNKSSIILFSLLLGLCQNLSAHEGHSNTKAVQACHQKNLSSDCSYILGENLYKGSCRVIANKSMCVRSEPIEFLAVDTELVSKSKDEEKKT